MSISMTALIVGIGFLIGSVSGLIGIGGGILIIPILMIGFGFTQARANGTSLAMMLPPIGLLAVITYSRAGNVDWQFAVLMAIGFIAGAAVGGSAVNRGWINPTLLRVAFAIVLLYLGTRTLFRTGGQARAAIDTIIVCALASLYTTTKLLGRAWETQDSKWGITYRMRRSRPSELDYEI
jgi:uncharacterized membrane protein YfcA